MLIISIKTILFNKNSKFIFVQKKRPNSIACDLITILSTFSHDSYFISTTVFVITNAWTLAIRVLLNFFLNNVFHSITVIIDLDF